MSIPRLVIGAAQGRSGKTTVTLGLCAALRARGLIVQPFKKGPDYIDPSWLSEAAGRPCRSLDPFFCGDDERLIAAFLAGAAGADIAIVEGNHGLYDGINLTPGPSPARRGELAPPSLVGKRDGGLGTGKGAGEPGDDAYGSTAAVARALAAPILLVVNTARMGRSVAALVHGYQTFEPDTPIAGMILNNVARGRHEEKLRAAVEHHCGIPVVGVLPRDEALSIPDRHLGLVPRGEDAGLLPTIAACRAAAERYFDLDAILAIARAAPPIPHPPSLIPNPQPSTPARIAVFRDRAFTFYYPENLEALEAAGAELIFVDAFRDPALPAVDALYIGGGFPEMFMDELSANAGLRASVRAAAEAGLPIYAECGGLMYLARRIIWGERVAEMAGVLPYDVEMTARPQGHGYVEAVVDADNPFFPIGTVLRGHEFHNSRLVGIAPLPSQGGEWGVGESSAAPGGLTTAYHLNRGNGIGGGRDGLVYRNVLASYTHLHIAAAPGWATALLRAANPQSLIPNPQSLIPRSDLLLLGLNHTIAPVEVRERLACGPERLAAALVELRAALTAAACACDDAAAEVAILSTCNRTEVYAWAGGDAEAVILRFLAGRSGLAADDLAGYLYVRRRDEAARHLLRVAAGLDSLVIGENEILGQVKAAYEAAHAAGTTGPVLSALFRYAAQAGKRVRSETAIGRAALSVATIVVEMAQEMFGSLADRTALLIGAGKMGSIAGQALVRAGLRCVLIANRTFDRAQQLAARLGGRAVRFDALAENLAVADIVICSTGAPHLVLHADDVLCALATRQSPIPNPHSSIPNPQPPPPTPQLLIVDLAVPRDADPAIAAIPGVRLADIDDLEAIVRANHPLAAGVRAAAEAIVQEELDGLRGWLAARCCAPVIQALRARADAICQAEVEKTLRRLGDLTPRQQELVAAMARAIANKLLHEPIVHLKASADGRISAEMLRTAEELFGLNS